MFTYRQNYKKSGSGNTMVTSDFWQEVEIRPFCNKKCNLALTCGQIAKIPSSYEKSGSENTTVTSDFRQEVEMYVFRACAVKKYALWHLFMAESPKFLHRIRNLGLGTWWWCPIFDRKYKYGRFAHAQWKICNLALTFGRIAKISSSYRKSGSGNTRVTSDF